MTTVTLKTIPRQTYAEFAALDEGTRAQLIDGEIIMSPAPSVLHQHIVSRLGRLMGNYAEEHDLGLVLVAPIDVRFSNTEAYQPDLIFIAKERLDIITEQEVDGAPDLVVEVLSPATGYYDLTKKRRVYEQSGVQEYWIVDPGERAVDVLALEDTGFRPVARVEATGHIASRLLDGFSVALAPLFEISGASFIR